MSEVLWELVNLQVPPTPGREGTLVVAELNKLPCGFASAPRVYWIVNSGEASRPTGGHYHPDGKCEVIVCAHGEIEVELHSVRGCEKLRLSTSSQALVVRSGAWHSLMMATGMVTVVLVMASTNYEPGEAITHKPCGCP